MSREIKRASFELYIKNATQKENGDVEFGGVASLFNIIDSDNDIILPGAFKNTLQKWREKGMLPPVLWQHDTREPVGKYTKIEEIDKGLTVEGVLYADDIPRAKQAARLLREKAIDGLSIGFSSAGPVTFDEENNTRIFHALDLWEISIVTFPAMEQARVSTVKSEDFPEKFNDLKSVEEFLRCQGFSRKGATRLVSEVKSLLHCDGANDIQQSEFAKELLRSLKVN